MSNDDIPNLPDCRKYGIADLLKWLVPERVANALDSDDLSPVWLDLEKQISLSILFCKKAMPRLAVPHLA